MNLFRSGDFTLSSGSKSFFKIDCDALVDEDIHTLSLMIKSLMGDFSSVEGIPRGGLRIAKALQSHITPHSGPHLICDDVFSTGNSFSRAIRRHPPICKPVLGAVIFARGPAPDWIKVLFPLPPGLWVPQP